MDINLALVALLKAIAAQDVEMYWQALDDLHRGSATTGKIPDVQPDWLGEIAKVAIRPDGTMTEICVILEQANAVHVVYRLADHALTPEERATQDLIRLYRNQAAQLDKRA